MDLAERLRNERVRLGFTQAQLAALSGIQPNAQCLYENGSRIPRADYLMCLDRVGVDVQYIVLGIQKTSAILELSHSEALIVRNLRTLNEADRGAIVRLMTTLSSCVATKRPQLV
ncbi:helix-turn-helix domain-containing protein [Pseudomonas viridiflava]|uniref:helix-turn-helix domain-containing protein n=2 Tax=Pseudomonas viridiflava TaxID=33069 RepID=UPI000F03CF1D|nr:helix-turn-helix transcriptional regulator [Pseudomonas viridiflava]MEE4123947.1 helix-turn-helix transcriptional regulator [Pseudomonas viridiflava]